MSESRERDYLVCYDIRESRRLQRVHRRLRRWGLPLQYSVFYCRLSAPRRRSLVRELEALIDESEDDVRLYPLPSGAVIHCLGRRPFPHGVAVGGLRFQCDENGSQLPEWWTDG